MIKGNGTSLLFATPGVDYQTPLYPATPTQITTQIDSDSFYTQPAKLGRSSYGAAINLYNFMNN